MLPKYTEKDKIYTIFNEILQSILNNRSYLVKKGTLLNVKDGLVEIEKHFLEHYDNSVKKFDQKLQGQFKKVSTNAKILFLHFEYLWSFANDSTAPETKRNYIIRLLPDTDINDINNFAYMRDPITNTLGIANFGVYHNTNKYYEIKAIIKLFKYLSNKVDSNSVDIAKKEIENLCIEAIYGTKFIAKEYIVTEKKCSIYNALLHLSNSQKHEMIVSFGDKKAIINKFIPFADDDSRINDEDVILSIKKNIFQDYNDYSSHGYGRENNKYLWFFYGKQIKSELGIRIDNNATNNTKSKNKFGSNATSENEYFAYYVIGRKKIRNLHNKLEKSFEKFLTTKNISFEKNDGYIDFTLTIDNKKHICELKPTDSSENLKFAIRAAIGQLIEYNYFLKNNKAKKIFVTSHKLNKDQIDFLNELNIKYLYQKAFGIFTGNALKQ